MQWLWFAAAGICGGVLAGMGMGGGTLTIPILVLLLSVDQLTAQFANLIAFLPTGAAALGVHLKTDLWSGRRCRGCFCPRLRRRRRHPFCRRLFGSAGKAVRRFSRAHSSRRAYRRRGGEFFRPQMIFRPCFPHSAPPERVTRARVRNFRYLHCLQSVL